MSKCIPLKILYGVQATGQGHITRARVLGPALQRHGADVDFLFSGRKREEMYGMEPFGDFATRRGLTFAFNHGQISPIGTVAQNNCFELLKDIATLDLKGYDLVITDYEPITAWAAKIKGVPSLGIGHQYAFRDDIPRAGFNRATLVGMNWFAPASQSFGIHWHHFDQDILPPMFEFPDMQKDVDPRKIVVYLNFEDVQDVVSLVDGFTDYDFHIYSSKIQEIQDLGHLKLKPTSSLFKHDIETCAGVICGAGFELPTEALYMGKKILVKAMDGQPEQKSNALALKQLGLGDVMVRLDPEDVKLWLEKPQGPRVVYPDTADVFARWIMGGQREPARDMARGLWKGIPGMEHIKR